MKISHALLVLIVLASAAGGQESTYFGGAGLDVSRLPPKPTPVGEIIIRDGQVFTSQAEADEAERKHKDLLEQVERAKQQPIHPVVAQQQEAAERKLWYGGVTVVIVVVLLLLGSAVRKPEPTSADGKAP